MAMAGASCTATTVAHSAHLYTRSSTFFSTSLHRHPLPHRLPLPLPLPLPPIFVPLSHFLNLSSASSPSPSTSSSPANATSNRARSHAEQALGKPFKWKDFGSRRLLASSDSETLKTQSSGVGCRNPKSPMGFGNLGFKAQKLTVSAKLVETEQKNAAAAAAAAAEGEKSSFNVSVPEFQKRLRISDIKEAPDEGLARAGETMTVRGWVRTCRLQETFSFIEVNDGSTLSNLQVVVDSDAEGYDTIESGLVTTGASLAVEGELIASLESEQKVELKASKVTLIGGSDATSFPVQEKELSRENGRTIAHVRPRTNAFGAAGLSTDESWGGADEAATFKDRVNVIDVLQERGLIESITGDELRAACSTPSSTPVKVYCGFDPTAECLHLGNLLGIIVLSWFQRCGHIPVVVMGGATAKVGDPSGKSIERPVMSEETISKNLAGIRSVLLQILNRDDSPESAHVPIFRNNYDWWKDFSLLDFLRDVAKYARVGTMMAKESVKRRLNSEEGMSYTEFTYQLLQGYDFVHLFKEEGVTVQIGGSDQWGNITAGTDLVRKLLHEEGAHGLTWPLLLKSDGTKFGKSEGGAIWLAASYLSPYEFYQYLFGTPDSDVIKLLKVLTFVGLEEIQAIEAAMGKPGYASNSAQKRLAEEVTRFVHGEQALADAQRATQALAPGATTELDVTALESIADNVPFFSLPRTEVLGLKVVDLCVQTKLQASKAAARRLISQGGLYLNNKKVVDDSQTVDATEFVGGRMLLLSAGKKNKLVVRLE